MQRPRRIAPAVAALAVAAIVAAPLAGCGDSKKKAGFNATTTPASTVPAPATSVPVTPPPVTPEPAPAVPNSQTSTTTGGASTAAPPPTPKHLETSPQELAKRAKARLAKAQASGARTCPDLTKPAEAQGITVRHISCATATKIIFATTPQQHNGFVCTDVGESFKSVPTVEYACKRKADKAQLNYTAVG
ncbi:MAG TPA: hypothetical protein VGF46_04480 [Gaiellales bacterium]|jgi:hypothetical protein